MRTRQTNVEHRRFAGFSRGLCGVAGAVALAFGSSAYAQSQGSITVNAYSGPWETAMKKCFFDPFTEETGVRVVIDSGVASVTYAKLRQQRAASGIDVAWLDGGYSEQAWEDGLLQEISSTAVPNMENLSSGAVYKSDDDEVFALGTGYFSYALAYDPEQVDPAPTSWFDLWDPKYAGRVYSPAPAQSLFTPFMMHLNTLLGGTNDNLDPVIDKYRELQASSYFEASGVMNATIQSGEVVLGVYYPNTVAQLQSQSVSIETATPKEGVASSDIRMHLVDGTANKEDAEKLINYVAQRAPLECIAEEIYLGPPVENPNLSEGASKFMPWGEGGSVDDLVVLDWDVVNEVRPRLRRLWNRRVIGQ